MGIPICVLAMVLALEQDAVVEDLVVQPGSNALKVNRSPNPFFSHEGRGKEVTERCKGFLNDLWF